MRVLATIAVLALVAAAPALGQSQFGVQQYKAPHLPDRPFDRKTALVPQCSKATYETCQNGVLRQCFKYFNRELNSCRTACKKIGTC